MNSEARRSKWVCAHCIQLPKEREQTTHCVHLRKKKTTCCGEDKSVLRNAAGDTVDDKCWILAWMRGVGRLSVLCHLINFAASSAFFCLALLSKERSKLSNVSRHASYYYQMKEHQLFLLLEKWNKRCDGGQKTGVWTKYCNPCHQINFFCYDIKGRIAHKLLFFFYIRLFPHAQRQENQSFGILLKQIQIQRTPVNHRGCCHLITLCPDSLHLAPMTQKLMTHHDSSVLSWGKQCPTQHLQLAVVICSWATLPNSHGFLTAKPSDCLADIAGNRWSFHVITCS